LQDRIGSSALNLQLFRNEWWNPVSNFPIDRMENIDRIHRDPPEDT